MDDGKWVIGYYQKRFNELENEEHYIFSTKNYAVWEYARIDPSTICQCTGLKGKNEKMIWENDVVKGHYYEKGKSHRFIGIVEYVGTSFLVKGVKQYTGLNRELNGLYSCIGNKFDNPELLEVGE